MPKKKRSSSSLKKPSQVVDNPAIQEAKRVLKPGKFGTEIDDIFAGRKLKKPEAENPETEETKAEIAKKKRKRKIMEINNNSESKPRKITKDGFKVYTEDEIGFNKANSGDTPLCPFDCNCCF